MQPNSEEWFFLVTSLCMEILSAACDQASSPRRPWYALFGMLLAIAALLTYIWELIYKGRKRGCDMLFSSVIELFGFVGGSSYTIINTTVNYYSYTILQTANNPFIILGMPSLGYISSRGISQFYQLSESTNLLISSITV